MKNLFLIFALFVGFASQGQVKVLGYITPNAPSDTYPTHIDRNGKGGFMTFATIAERNAIPTLRRAAGMMAYVADSGKTYQLQNDLTTWSTPLFGGNALNEVDPLFVAHVAHSITQANIDFWNRIALLPFYSTTDSMLSKIDSATRAHDYRFDSNYFTVTNRFVTFNQDITGLERDPLFIAHVASSITQADIDRWNSLVDLSPYLTAIQTRGEISDSIAKYKYYVDGQTILGLGTLQDPFHAIPFGDTNYIRDRVYSKEQIDSIISNRVREYGAGYGLMLENYTFRVDTTLFPTVNNYHRMIDSLISVVNNNYQSADTAVQDIVQVNSNTLRVVKKTSTQDIIFGTGGGGDFYTKAQVDSIIASLDLTDGDTTTIIRDTSSITIGDKTTWYIFNPVSVRNSLTVTLAANPVQGQEIKISFGGIITSGNVVNNLTISPNSGQTILQATTPSSVEAGEVVSYKYNSANSKWYRL